MKIRINMDLELLFLILSVLITGGLAINSHISSKKNEKSLKLKTEEVVRLQEEISVKSNKLIEVQDELLKYTTGGGSFGQVEILKISNSKGGFIYSFYFANKGNYPLYDVSITVLNRSQLDMQEVKKRHGLATLEDLQKYNLYKIGNISSNGGTSFGTIFPLSNNQINDFLFSIHTRNGSYSQQLRFIELSNEILQATKLNTIDLTGKGSYEVLVDTADERFPGSIKGKIKWE
jgi:hypothetical protein